MINESFEWKEAIKRNNSYIRRFAKIALKDDSDFPSDRIQMRIITNALFCRRLLETPKVASELKRVDLPVVAYPWSGSQVDYMNAHKIDGKYLFDSPNKETLKAPVLGNYIIHSFVWMWGADEDENLDSFFVSSDRIKEKKLYHVSLKVYLDFLQFVARSYPARLVMTRDHKSGQWN